MARGAEDKVLSRKQYSKDSEARVISRKKYSKKTSLKEKNVGFLEVLKSNVGKTRSQKADEIQGNNSPKNSKGGIIGSLVQPGKKDTELFTQLFIEKNKIYPVVIVAKMSAGKSTLLNALAGREILPSKNLACTEKIVAILDNDSMNDFKLHIVDQHNNYRVFEKVNRDIVERYNSGNDIKELIIEGEINGIKNCEKAVLLIDTPGINNSLNVRHHTRTLNTIRKVEKGLIVYVVDGNSPCVNDDKVALGEIKEIINGQNTEIIFAVNKMDDIDTEKESLVDLILETKNFLEENGFAEPTLVIESVKMLNSSGGVKKQQKSKRKQDGQMK